MSGHETSGISDALVRISKLLKREDVLGAIAQCHALLKQSPDNPDALRFLGLGYLRQENLAAADKYLSQAMQFGLADPSLMNTHGIVRLKQAAYEEAINLFSHTLKIRPNDSDALSNLALAFTMRQQPDHAKSYLDRLTRVLPYSAAAHKRASENRLSLSDVAQAIRYARKAVRLQPTYLPGRLALADALEASGQFRQAKFQYLAVLEEDTAHPGALAGLLSLKGVSVQERYVSRTKRLLDGTDLADADRVRLNLALAHYLDQCGQYANAFERLKAGNALRSANHPFDSAAYSRAVERLIGAFSVSIFASLPHPEITSKRPIFIIGMPRSGTTLVEQILASHSQVAAGGELPTIVNIAGQIKGAGTHYPESVHDLDKSSIEGFARQYLDKLKRISSDAAHVTDKMPFNFMHLGLIAALFPGAKIIHCARDPLDTCLSCYFTTFNEQLQFASDLETLGRYWLDYHRLMQHWQTTLSVPIYQVRYERLVTNAEECVRELLAFCELSWEPACLRFYELKRGVRTPSRWQVRQPIYGQSVGRWRHYEEQLAPLRDVLSDAGSTHKRG